MQFYLNGYNPGDPDIQAAAPGAEARPAALPDTTDVLIVGAGPAGMLLAAQLSAFPGITTRIVDRREGPLQVGQADGVACRTVEMFDAFGLCCLAGAGHQPLERRYRERPAALGHKHEWGNRILLALQPAQRPQLVAVDRVHRRRAVLGSPDV